MSFINFSGSYQPPGVYVTAQIPQSVQASTVANTAVALVGPTRGYATNTDTVVLSGTAQPLSKYGINASTITVTDSYGNAIPTANYTLSPLSGQQSPTQQVTIVQAGTPPTTGTWTSFSQPVYVSYQYTDAAFSNPQTFTSYNAIQAYYGPAYTATGTLNSPITLAAQLLYSNGNPTTVCVPTADTSPTATTQANLKAAYSLLAANTSIGLVVPLPVGITTQATLQGCMQDLAAHCEGLASQQIYRIGIFGYDSTVALSTFAPNALISGSGADPRVVLAFPNQMSLYYQPTNTNLTVSGYYLAAAYAGVLASGPVQQGLTRRVVNGFAGISSALQPSMTKLSKNSWSSGGVAVAEISSTGSLVCRQGVTTSTSSVINQEISLVRSADSMMSSLQTTILNTGLIGSPTTTNTPSLIQQASQSCLDLLTANGTIVGYSSLSVSVQSFNPTVITVSFQYQPAYPLNYVSVSFGVDASTGFVTQTV